MRRTKSSFCNTAYRLTYAVRVFAKLSQFTFQKMSFSVEPSRMTPLAGLRDIRDRLSQEEWFREYRDQ